VPVAQVSKKVGKDRRIDRNFSYARKEVLSGKTHQRFPAQ